MNQLKNCHDCGVIPGKMHKVNCDVERCSICGGQLLSCGCKNTKEHDPAFARWTGIWPGELESKYLGIDLNDFYSKGFYKIFFIKPSD